MIEFLIVILYVSFVVIVGLDEWKYLYNRKEDTKNEDHSL